MDWDEESDTGAMQDPFRAMHDEGNGVDDLRAALGSLRKGDGPQALECLARARGGGIPVEAVPHAALTEAFAQLLTGNHTRATAVLRAAWSDHPDVAALAAALGMAQYAAGDERGAARALLASVVCDDPDRSLPTWRWALTRYVSAP